MEKIKLSEIIDDLIQNAKEQMKSFEQKDDKDMYWYWRGRFEAYVQIKKSPVDF